MSSPGDGTPTGRRMGVGKIAALVSAIVAVVGLLLAVFGGQLTGASPPGRSLAYGADAPSTSTVSPTPTASATPTVSRTPVFETSTDPESAAAVPTSFASATPAGSQSAAPPALPAGWQRVREPDLTVTFAVPDGWTRATKNELQSNWQSPDGSYAIGVKRDTTHGSTPESASAGQLAWYRNTAESRMADLNARSHPIRQSGKDALWLEMDYHWVGQAEPRKRVELFVAGQAGQVYQLLVDTAATPEKREAQRQMFATAREQLLIDT
ncbi:hypothetical protein [Parafrankia sp. EUN1f]|uniref:hypothetical protein n=1 Tax=Parafrankia sp. EUN1f TaxID=102897 RepID=UPI0001C47165|nr:hypothetical protein [Parafrankia sp. EUN1f]EFC79687.1 hypothetical protein FrEUN1fDRAFT_7198 [Parafrankia sp. EUN1f]